MLVHAAGSNDAIVGAMLTSFDIGRTLTLC